MRERESESESERESRNGRRYDANTARREKALEKEVTYFVTNIPKEATKREFQKTFGRFGRLSDVYMGLNTGKDGQHYVFIRFLGVQDTREMETKLDGTILRGKRLAVNISKHDRRPLQANVGWKLPPCKPIPRPPTGGAKNFWEDSGRWKSSLTQLCWADTANIDTRRVAWVRIVGLPIRLWGQKNFTAITKQFGETIAPFDGLANRVDLSCAKIGILTEHRARINTEFHVACENEIMRVGVIEFDEDWFPFRFDPREIYLEDAYGRDVVIKDVEIESAPETNSQIPEDTREEGEFVPEAPTTTHKQDTDQASQANEKKRGRKKDRQRSPTANPKMTDRKR
ncbi:hypothetical protein LXL04_016672 [Taraxacum kok-saghyz]